MLNALEKCFSPAQLGGLTLRNRLIKAATSEGMTPGGLPGDALTRFHKRLGDGGIGMTTLAYCAVEPDGRLHENMMHMHDGIRPQLQSLIDAIHETGAAVSGQMAHCGGFSKNTALTRRRPLAPSFGFNRLGAAKGMLFCDAMSEADIADVIRAYGEAAVLMKQVGFDAVEIHFGHGYLLSQFISGHSNRRRDRYGGSLDNRMRVPLAVLEHVRQSVGDGYPILGKISLYEDARGGLTINDAIHVARMLDAAGIDGIVTSGGSSVRNPMLLFHGPSILKPMLAAESNPAMRVAMRLAAPAMFKSYPWQALYFMEAAKRIRAAVDCAVIYVGGASSSEDFATLMKEGFDFIQLGRSLLSDPDLPRKAASDAAFTARCTHCNACVATIEAPPGVHCTQFPESAVHT